VFDVSVYVRQDIITAELKPSVNHVIKHVRHVLAPQIRSTRIVSLVRLAFSETIL